MVSWDKKVYEFRIIFLIDRAGPDNFRPISKQNILAHNLIQHEKYISWSNPKPRDNLSLVIPTELGRNFSSIWPLKLISLYRPWSRCLICLVSSTALLTDLIDKEIMRNLCKGRGHRVVVEEDFDKKESREGYRWWCGLLDDMRQRKVGVIDVHVIVMWKNIIKTLKTKWFMFFFWVHFVWIDNFGHNQNYVV